jgi:AcrR family transcriptional regulator
VTTALSRERPTPKAQRTREQILQASLAAFRARGFDRTSMRDIATRAGLSLGSTYYYFDSKDEIVFAFYAQTQADAEARNQETIAATSVFSERLRDVILFKLGQLAEYRGFIVVLARSAMDPRGPLSPFSPETRELRDGAIRILEQVIEGSDLKVHRSLRPHLARLLWFFQMGVIFFWIHDHSPAQARTRRVVDASLALLTRLFALTAARLPGVGKLVSLGVVLLEELAIWEGAPLGEGEA